MIIPIIIGAVSIVFLLFAVYIKKHIHLPNDSPTAVGEIIGKDVVGILCAIICILSFAKVLS